MPATRFLRRVTGAGLAALLALSAGLPASAQTPAPDATRQFGQWVFGCQGAPSKSTCVIVQTIHETLSRSTVFVWLVRYDEQGNLVAYFRTPTGVYTSRGILMQLDSAPALRVDYERCEPSGCQAVFSIGADLQKQLAAAKEVVATLALTSGQGAGVRLSMDGFADALAALAAAGGP